MTNQEVFKTPQVWLTDHSPVVVQLSGRQRAEHQGPAAPGDVSIDPGSAPDVLDHEAVLVAARAVLQVHLGHLDADPGVRGHGVQDPLTREAGRVVARPVTWAGQRLQVGARIHFPLFSECHLSDVCCVEGHQGAAHGVLGSEHGAEARGAVVAVREELDPEVMT